MDIVPRTLGYSNYMMWQDCERLKKVILATYEVKEGRGKNITTKKVLKHNTPQHIIDKIVNSVEYYKTEYLNEMKSQPITLRDYQIEIADRATAILKQYGFVYLAMEVRTGKTLTSLTIADKLGAHNVLFLTKKKAISSIINDFDKLAPSFSLVVTNYESMHKLDPDMDYDLVICDEAHGMGAFPKPSNRAKDVKELIDRHKCKVVLLSGTPTPESYSQMYHQVYGIPNNPFSKYKSFYRFADDYVKVVQKKVNGMFINDYSKGSDEIIKAMQPYTISFSQKQAGFVVQTTEHVLPVRMKDKTYQMIDKIQKDLVIQGKDEVILADTAVKLMSKMHQMYSGTIKFESGNSMVLDLSKAEFIRERFRNKKIGIFYKFKEEYNALKQVFGDYLTDELSEFEDDNSKSIALQIVSGREGISLRDAEALVYYNIDFSATSYWQSRDRMTTKDRLKNDVYWVFAEDGIEYDIYKAVSKKKDYTVNHFKNKYQ